MSPIFKKKEKKQKESPKEEKGSERKRKTSKLASLILMAPHITEKATDLSAKNQYVFKVFPKANKSEIKKAIKDCYGTEVLSVRIINVPRKQKRIGRFLGYKSGYKKAIVKIKEGQKIEILPR